DGLTLLGMDKHATQRTSAQRERPGLGGFDNVDYRPLGLLGGFPPDGEASFAGLRVRRKETICQRCVSGKRANGGIPFFTLPLVIFQKSAPSLCFCTSGVCRLAASSIPVPSSPWHSPQLRRNNFFPPAAAWAFPASGFSLVAASGGATNFGSVLECEFCPTANAAAPARTSRTKSFTVFLSRIVRACDRSLALRNYIRSEAGRCCSRE